MFSPNVLRRNRTFTMGTVLVKLLLGLLQFIQGLLTGRRKTSPSLRRNRTFTISTELVKLLLGFLQFMQGLLTGRGKTSHSLPQTIRKFWGRGRNSVYLGCFGCQTLHPKGVSKRATAQWKKQTNHAGGKQKGNTKCIITEDTKASLLDNKLHFMNIGKYASKLQMQRHI